MIKILIKIVLGKVSLAIDRFFIICCKSINLKSYNMNIYGKVREIYKNNIISYKLLILYYSIYKIVFNKIF